MKRNSLKAVSYTYKIQLLVFTIFLLGCVNDLSFRKEEKILFDTIIYNDYFKDSLFQFNKTYSWEKEFDNIRYDNDSTKSLVVYRESRKIDSVNCVKSILLRRRKDKYQIEIFDYSWRRCNDTLYHKKRIVIANPVTGESTCIYQPKYLIKEIKKEVAMGFLTSIYRSIKWINLNDVDYKKDYLTLKVIKEDSIFSWDPNVRIDFEKNWFPRKIFIENDKTYIYETNNLTKNKMKQYIKTLKSMTEYK